MKSTIIKIAVHLALAILTINGAFCLDSAPDQTTALPQLSDKTDIKVSIIANPSKAKDVFESLAKQSEEKIVFESSVKGDIKLASLTDVSLESALTAICKVGNWEWRKVYISSDSKLTEQPDRLAAIVRLMFGLSFPDILVTGSSMDKYGTYFNDKASVLKAESDLTKGLKMTRVYLITNDVAVAAKALADKNAESADKAVDNYTDLQKQLMDAFMKMTPEEREQAIMASLNMMDQIDPGYISASMQALMNANPEALKRVISRQSDYLFQMTQDQRRAMMKMQMQMSTSMTPEQMQILQEDAKAVMEELKAEQGK